jgi:ribosomal protein S18 acetylase RimI-like enzyme
MKYTLRAANVADRDPICTLYKKVIRISGGLARREEEVTGEYVAGFIERSLENGIQLVAIDDKNVVGEIHCYKAGIQCFDHLLGDLTIAVDPDYQGQGVGKALFIALLNEVKENRKDILRIELLTGESNKRAIAFYQSIGFIIEGRMPSRYKLGPADLARVGADPANEIVGTAPASGTVVAASAPGTVAATPSSFDADIPMAWINPAFGG